MTDIWLIVAMVSMLEAYVLEEPSFKTEAESKSFAIEHVEDLNLHVNMEFGLSIAKINPLMCITKKELDDNDEDMIIT